MDTSSLVNADDPKTPYNGSKQVSVTVKYDNAYKLKVTAGDVVEYKLDKDGKNTTFFDANNIEQDLGTLDKTTASIAPKAHLTGTAAKSGKYIDPLHYVFKEK